MIESFKVKKQVRLTKQVISVEEIRVPCNCLIKQTHCFEQFLVPGRINRSRSDKFLGLYVELIGNQIGCRRLRYHGLLARRDVCAKLVSDRFRDLALDGEDVGEVSIIGLRPKM